MPNINEMDWPIHTLIGFFFFFFGGYEEKDNRTIIQEPVRAKKNPNLTKKFRAYDLSTQILLTFVLPPI